MNVSIAKARALVCACAELQSENGLIIGTAVEIYKNLVRADERMLSDFAERAERQFFQREAIVGCRVLAGLVDCLYDEDVRKSLCRSATEVRRLTATWMNAEKRQLSRKE